MSTTSDAIREVITLAGGRVVGKTRLQKSVYVLELAGVGYGFPFSYYHYGPYSEDLSWAVKDAVVDQVVKEDEDQARWGGTYSIFSVPESIRAVSEDPRNSIREEILSLTVKADAVVLELSATAALLKGDGCEDWWGETARRKPLKASPEAMAEAAVLWRELRSIGTPIELPDLD